MSIVIGQRRNLGIPVGRMMRGDQLSRQWRVLRHLEAGRMGLTAQDVAEIGGCSLRTAYRDIDDLQLAGFPMYSEDSDKGLRWKLLKNAQGNIPAPFTFTELMSLHLSRDLFKVFSGTVFHDSIESLFQKTVAQLPPQTLSYLNRIQSAFHTSIKPYKDYGRYREIINQVNRAVLEQHRIEIAYQPLRSDTETIRKVDPYKIWFFDGTIYLIGLCHLRSQVRTFVVDRVRMMTVSDEQFELPDDFDFEDLIRHSFRVMQDELYAVQVRVSPEWARYVGERIWHESQSIQQHIDGSIEITFHVAGLEEIKQWVLSMGPEVCVLNPPELIAEVIESLDKSKAQYEGVDIELPSAVNSEDGLFDEVPQLKLIK